MFHFHRPTSLDKALRLARSMGQDALFYAGGTDLLPAYRAKLIRPKHLIYLGSIGGLSNLGLGKGFIRIGALATHGALASSSLIRTHIPLLAEACGSIGSPQVRNLGTLGGNLCWGSPAADTVPVLLVYDARLRLAGHNGEREIPVAEFFQGKNRTALQPGEMLSEILVPKPRGRHAGVFEKIGRRKAMAISVVSCAALLFEGGARLRLALGSVAPFPFRVRAAEEAWREIWNTHDPDGARRVAETAMGETRPISDGRAPAWYRRRLSGVVVRRSLDRCLSALGGMP